MQDVLLEVRTKSYSVISVIVNGFCDILRVPQFSYDCTNKVILLDTTNRYSFLAITCV